MTLTVRYFAWLRERSLAPAAHDFIAQVRAVEAELVEAEKNAVGSGV